MDRRRSGGLHDFVDDGETHPISEEDAKKIDEAYGKSGQKRRGEEYVDPPQGNSYNKPNFTDKIVRKLENFKYWLFRRKHQNHYFSKSKFIQNTVIFLVIALIFLTLYSNVEEFNTSPLLFLKLGSTILIALLLGSLYFLRISFRQARHWYLGSMNIVKYGLLLFLLLFAYNIYENQEDYKEVAIGVYEELDYNKFNPFAIKLDKPTGVNKPVAELSADEENYFNATEVFSGLEEIFDNSKDISEIEQLVFAKVNSARTTPLKWNDDLAKIARGHSEDIAARNFFDHTNPDGDGPTERAEKAGINTRTPLGGGVYAIGIAENISNVPMGDVIGCGNVYSEEAITNCAVSGWTTSPGHYRNMINTDYSETGVGVAQEGNDFYLTQTFR
ncbi:MAG: CAP domain-containing protein [Candidatus Diapherotrites archaeon]